jgi:hypothetical protein
MEHASPQEAAQATAATLYADTLADERYTVLAALTDAVLEGIRLGIQSSKEEVEQIASQRDMLKEMLAEAVVALVTAPKGTKPPGLAFKEETIPCPWCGGNGRRSDHPCEHCEGRGKVVALTPHPK